MKAPERERRDWFVIPLILGIGFLCVIVAGQWALRFSPSWKVNADMESNLDPNSDFLTRRPSGFTEPVDPSILTEPSWINLFLTPGASFVTGTPFPKVTTTSDIQLTVTHTSTPISLISATNTAIVIPSSTNTFIYSPPTSSSTPKAKPSSTAFPAYTTTITSAVTASSTSASSATQTYTATSTPSSTPTSTPTPTTTLIQTFTNTPDASEPDFGGPDGNTTTLGNSVYVEFNLSGFLLDGNSSWDAVYYEKEEVSSAGKIHLGRVRIEVYDQTTSAWYTIYYWGDGVADTNASYNNGNSEPDGFPVDKSQLSGPSPLNTGIAIDIDTPAIGQGGSVGDSITKIRITSLSNANCDIDSLQMLR